jgi:hypothetical protein
MVHTVQIQVNENLESKHQQMDTPNFDKHTSGGIVATVKTTTHGTPCG